MSDAISALEDEAPVSPVSATVLSLSGEPLPDGVVEALRREVIEVSELGGLGHLPATPPTSRVVVLWLPTQQTSYELERLARWASEADHPVGLIGCTRSGDRADAESALAAGFDDYVIGEISIRELAARIRALTRRLQRSADLASDGPRFGSITLDPTRHQMWNGGRRIVLTRTELAVMSALIAARGRAISRAEILDAAWGEQSFDVGERAVDNVIMRLRRKLDDKDAVITVRGVGFRLAER